MAYLPIGTKEEHSSLSVPGSQQKSQRLPAQVTGSGGSVGLPNGERESPRPSTLGGLRGAAHRSHCALDRLKLAGLLQKEGGPAERGRSRAPVAFARGNQRPALPSWFDTLVKVFTNWLPSEFTTVMITTEMPAAIRPYSMAVAPDSSRIKRTNTDFMPAS